MTVVDVDWKDRLFSVMLIAYTQEKVILPMKKEGDKVNLEVDQIGKYVENIYVGMLQNENGPLYAMMENKIKQMIQK